MLSSVYFKVKVYENVYDENGILATPQYSELQEAIKKANSFVSTEDKDVAGGVPSLDSNTKVPVSELYEATTTNKGVTQLTDSVTSDSTTTAATSNSVKSVNDSLNSEISRATSAENTLTTNLNSEISRAKSAEKTNSDAISSEISRATTKENEIANNLSSHTGNTSNPHSVTKAQVGLGNVEDKSSATIRGEITKSNITTALGYAPLNQSLKGSADGLAELDSNGKVPSSQLPSYVDDVIEGYLSGGKFYKESAHTTEISGESGKIYIDLHTGKTYRWSGSTFGVISETLALGETSSTAYRGDRGKVAYDHSQTAHAPSNAQQNVQSDWNATSGDAFIKNKPAIPTKVGELTNDKDYATKNEVAEAIDDIEIGGRNLLVGTKDFNITNAKGFDGNNSYILTEKYNGFSIRYSNIAWHFYRPVISLKKGTYTFSIYAKGTDGIKFFIEINNIIKNYDLTSDWERYIFVFDVEEDKDVIIYSEVTADYELYQCGWKLENGNKATPWTPAPEDTEAEIQSVDNKLTTNLLKPTLGTTTRNGVTCTNNGDGTYTLNGTATGQPIFWLNENVNVIGSNLKLVGCPPNVISAEQGYLKIMYDNNEWGESESGDGVSINSGKNILKVIFALNDGITVNNLVIKPMITTNLNATYDDFVPYTGSTGQINSDVAEVRKDFDEHTHEIADVTGLQSALDGKLDKFTSGGIAACTGDGKYSYFKIATIKITSPWINSPIVFELSGRGRGLSLVTIEFVSWETTDPMLAFFNSDCDNCFWIKKTATSTWEVYGEYNELWGSYVLHRITGAGADIGVTVNMTNIDSLPSGCTQVSYGGNVNYANSAGNADTATALTTSAGSSSQPVYFSDGKPVAGKFVYEEGTWSPEVGYGIPVSVYSFENGKYTRIGNIVHCSLTINMTGDTSEAIYVDTNSLPFSISSGVFMGGQIHYGINPVIYQLHHIFPISSFESEIITISPNAPTHYVTFTYRIA